MMSPILLAIGVVIIISITFFIAMSGDPVSQSNDDCTLDNIGALHDPDYGALHDPYY